MFIVQVFPVDSPDINYPPGIGTHSFSLISLERMQRSFNNDDDEDDDDADADEDDDEDDDDDDDDDEDDDDEDDDDDDDEDDDNDMPYIIHCPPES